MSSGDNINFEKILELVRSSFGLDFSGYRDAILKRRVLTRVRIKKLDGLEAYFLYLQDHPEELEKLIDALTINVTEFFRDPRVFEFIETDVLPLILNKRASGRGDKIKIWSCGSSSGEEAYSLVISILELLGPNSEGLKIEIIGTDIDRRSLDRAVEAVYERPQLKNLSGSKEGLIRPAPRNPILFCSMS